ncbi:competence protein CoiA family protein [Oceanirhabdus seepicola]|uniref:Competence protein CoiA-like N-terminal domain-containing protein n=1 Tax=Oceanirhabdus seepicola TaxID=2828781 RepID=A0A9J6NYL4_9CLOT|nr:competence protein CoiA family protein [Oceanirhabdus seepicola]MCM1989140.1 hypothetical protein [Oceanirhabdus seepicola]
MQKCIWLEEEVCAFDIYDPIQRIVLDKELEIKLRAAAKRNELLCPLCNEPVTFRMRDVKKRKPHFAHKNNNGFRKCTYNEETEEHIEGIFILKRHLEKMYPDYKIRYKFNSCGKLYSDLYIEDENGNKMALEYERQDLDFEYWKRKHEVLRKNNIKDFWLIKCPDEVDNQYLDDLSFFKRYIDYTEDMNLMMLNIETERILLSKGMEIKDESGKVIEQKVFQKWYKLSEVRFLFDGSVSTEPDFTELYNEKLRLYEGNIFKNDVKMKNERSSQFKDLYDSILRSKLTSEMPVNDRMREYYTDIFTRAKRGDRKAMETLMKDSEKISRYGIIRELLFEFLGLEK